MVKAHPGGVPLTMEGAAQQMKDACAHENQHKVDAWNVQQEEDLVEQGEQDRLAREAEEARRAQQNTEAEETCKEADRKKPKLDSFDQAQYIEKWVEARPAAYALNKLSNLEYVELDYFTPRSCRGATTDAIKSSNHDTLTFSQVGNTFAMRPLATLRPSKHVRNDEELSWEDMMDATNIIRKNLPR